mgnify:CR=1 FL=1
MNYLSLGFFAFFAVLLIGLRFTRNVRQQNVLLLLASYVFYALGDVRFLGLLIGVSVLMWVLGKGIGRELQSGKAKRYLVSGVIADVLVLGLFKYYNFFAESFGSLLGMEYTVLHMILPIGISFYIFQSISYLADVYTGKIEAEVSVLPVMLYIGFFPQIVSGPIVKAHDFLPQVKVHHKITWERLSSGAQRFLMGAFKKTVIADRLGVAVNAVYAAPDAYSGLSLLLTVLAYSLQIYYDFSGYSDMAIGVAYILGFDLGANFNLPYLAKNPSDFWRRWHISLSSWFRDYVYIPLGGSRKGRVRTYLNLFITMLLSGLWHGASWAFVVWGAMHAVASVLHKGFADLKKKFGWDKKGSKFLGGISVLAMFVSVSVLWIPFRLNDFGQSLRVLKRIVTWSDGVDYVYVFTVIFAVLLLAVELIALLKNRGNHIWKPLDLSHFGNKVIVCLFLLLVVCFAYIGNSAFIYAQF